VGAVHGIKGRHCDAANEFFSGINLRHDIWSEIINDEENGGSMVPIWALAFEHDPDPKMRQFEEPIDDKKNVKI